MQRNRPTPPPRRYYRLARQRPWPAVSWWYSILFAIPVLILIGMGIASLFDGGDGPDTVEIAITDQATGQPLQGAIVTVGDQQVESNDRGIAAVDRPSDPTTIVVQAVNYEPMHGTIDNSSHREQAVALRSSSVSGVLTDGATGQPIAGARITVLANGEPTQLSATTGEDGAYSLNNVPASATLRIEADGYEPLDQATGGAAQVNVTAQPAAAASDDAGASGDQQSAQSTENRDDEADSQPRDTSGLPEVPEMVRAIYVSASAAADPATLDSIITLVNETELNAVVVDIKEDYIWYDTSVDFFLDANAVNPIYDAGEVLQKFKDNGIYTIARLVVFKDPVVAENRPDLAIRDDNGGLWRGWQGEAWVNPFYEELWEANIQLAVEAAQLGFDEIQYDYVRFPSDGDLSTADFGQGSYTMDDRVGAISSFLDASHERINEGGAWLGADVFGIIALYDDDQGIGQYLRDLVKHVDFVCPMVYPSHFDAGSILVGGGGEPNDYPAEVIEISMAAALDKMPGMEEKLRPWLQDFSLGGMMPYGPNEVRAQIDAAEASGATGWMLWNSGAGTNNEDALNPE
jgi:hypothetical protein